MSRADRLQDNIAQRELGALLVSDLVNVRYLTGFTGSNAIALVGPGIRRFLTDFRYATQIEQEVPDEWDRVIVAQDLLAGAVAQAPDGELRLGFDDAQLSVKAHGRLAQELGERAELVAAGGMVEALRAVKDDLEIARIRAAAQLADEALQEVLEAGLVGRSEQEVAFALEVAMRRLGAQAPAFESIVASAEHGARPHAVPRDVPIAPDALVIIDWGARLDGYCSDCTRTFATGENLGDEERAVYDLVLRAQRAALGALAPGRTGRQIDAVAREIIDREGHAEHFGHGTGHGVGLAVHEGPNLSRLAADAELEAGNVVTIEPGVYVPGRLGVRIEDLVALSSGGPDVLSTLPKELRVVA